MASKDALQLLFSEMDHEVAKIWLNGSFAAFIFQGRFWHND